MSSKSDARDGSAGASSSDLLQLQVFGHAGHVKLQQAVGNQQALVRHCITLETAELPHAADGWTLVFEKTFGAVCNTSSDVVIELDDLFKKQLCTDAKGHFFGCGAAAEYAAEGVEPQREAMHVQRCEGPVCTGPYKGSTPSPMLFTWFPTSCWLPFFLACASSILHAGVDWFWRMSIQVELDTIR